MTSNNNSVPIEHPESFKHQQPPSTPRDARIIAILLASMGVQSASEGVVRVLMEFAHRKALFESILLLNWIGLLIR